MNENKAEERIYKEELKKIVDHSPKFTEQIKTEVKAIIDAGKTPGEILAGVIAYFCNLR